MDDHGSRAHSRHGRRAQGSCAPRLLLSRRAPRLRIHLRRRCALAQSSLSPRGLVRSIPNLFAAGGAVVRKVLPVLLVLAPSLSSAIPLPISPVGAPAVNCVFSPTC